jgi:leader peptidase (prepilin peptidase)/N-methyltransferase
VVLLSAVQGAVVGAILIATRRDHVAPQADPSQREAAAPPADPGDAARRPTDDDWVPPKHAVPYGPFLALGALEYLFFGEHLVSGWNALLFRLFS